MEPSSQPDGAPDSRSSTARIGHYRPIRLLGEGGMGEVWLAEQEEPIRRKVALKLIKHGPGSREVVGRFMAERQALAMMDHPCIAKVFDAGAAPDGRPYFVMELVEGLPITQYCDREELTTSERLRLFQQVCLAVHHAHQKGVVHRDLKPSNVLVVPGSGAPLPKVIDFGIAKALEQPEGGSRLTETLQIIGTPEYMPPEQADSSGKDVDTRSDVYSLGVLLYELLTGTLPFDLGSVRDIGLHEFLRMIREVDPPKPSTRLTSLKARLEVIARRRQSTPRGLRSTVRGDLDWVVMKAMEKDRMRRYPAASALAEDIGRFLLHEPVAAGPPSASYRLRKYVQRHTIGVASSAAVMVALVGGGISAWRGYLEADEQRLLALEREELAHREAAKAGRIVELLRRMLHAADPSQAKGADYEVRELLEDFERELGEDLAREPEVDAFLRSTIGNAFLNLGLYEKARAQLERAHELRNETLGARAPQTVDSFGDLVFLRFQEGDLDGAARGQLELIERTRALVGDGDPALAKAHSDLASMLEALGRLTEAEQALGQALAVRKRIAEQDPTPEARKLLAQTRGALGRLLDTQGEHARAVELLQESIGELRVVAGSDRWEVSELLTYLGRALRERNDLTGSEAACREALAIDSALYGPESFMVAIDMDELGSTLQRMGRIDEGLELNDRSRGIARRILGESHPDFLMLNVNFGVSLINAGRVDEAAVVLEEVLAAGRGVLGPESLSDLLANLGSAHLRLSDPDRAEPLLQEGLELAVRSFGDESPATLTARTQLALVRMERGDHVSAEQELRAAVAIGEHALGEDHPEVLKYLRLLAQCRLEGGDAAEASALLERVLAGHRRIYPPGDVRLARSLEELALALPPQGVERSEDLLREALALRPTEGPDAHLHSRTQARLGRVLVARSDLSEAEPLLRMAESVLAASSLGAEAHGEALLALVELCAASGRLQEAAAWRAKLEQVRASHEGTLPSSSK